MPLDPSAQHNSLAPQVARQFDKICDQFEADWKSGRRPRIDVLVYDFAEPDRSVLLRDLLTIDLEYRRKNSESPKLERYLQRFTEHSPVIRQVFADFDSGKSYGLETAATRAENAEVSETRGVGTGFELPKAVVSGKKLGRFELIEVVGQGAFGTVYRARDPQLERDVALKVPRSGVLVEREEVERFLREARAAAQLRHPNIVAVYEAGKVDQTYYIASAFVRGTTLREASKSGRRFTHEETAPIVSQLASALHYAHTQGVIHRDVKPGNIMLDEHGEPQIMDFGLARYEGDALRTVEGTRMGTPAYMSPEQAQGQSHLADARTDIWSLGVILYELLTGRRPFQGNEVEVLNAIQDQNPPAPRSVDTSIPRDMETICVKCLAKDRKDRFASAQRLADELDRWLRDEPITFRPIGFIERTARWFKREPMLAGLTSAATVLALVGTLVAVWTARHATTSQREIGRFFAQAQEQETTAEKKKREALEQARVAEEQSEIAKKSAQRAGEALVERRQEEAGLQRAMDEAAKTAAERKMSEAESGEALSKAQQEFQRGIDASKARQETETELESRILSLEYAQRIAEIDRLVKSDDKKRAVALLVECDVRDRSWEWGYLSHLCEGAEAVPVTLEAEPDASELIFTEHGKLVTAGKQSFSLFDVEIGTKKVTSLQHDRPVLSLLSSHTLLSRTTVFSSYSYMDGEVLLVRDLATGNIRGKFRPFGEKKGTHVVLKSFYYGPSWSANYTLATGQALNVAGDILALPTRASSSLTVCKGSESVPEACWAEVSLLNTSDRRVMTKFPAFEGTWAIKERKVQGKHPVYAEGSRIPTGEVAVSHIHETVSLKVTVDRICFSPDKRWLVAISTVTVRTTRDEAGLKPPTSVGGEVTHGA